MNQKAAIAVVALFMLACVGAVVWTQEVHSSPPSSGSEASKTEKLQKPVRVPTEASSTDTGRIMSVESYIATHIGDFASVKSKLGSEYHVDEVVAHGGDGTIYYHDGSVQHVADFTYSTDNSGTVTINSFTVTQ